MENTENQKTIEDWRKEITESKETLKVNDGQSIEFIFADEGSKRESKDYGTSICFSVLVSGEKTPRFFYVKANNFDLLGQIKALGTLTGTNARISRTGSKRSDTRYKIVRLN